MTMRNMRSTILPLILVLIAVQSFGSTAGDKEGAPKLDGPVRLLDPQANDRQPTEQPIEEAEPRKWPGCVTGPFPVPLLPGVHPRAPIEPKPTLPRYLNASIVNMIQQINEPLVLGYLQDLTAFGPRVTESFPCQAAGEYIYDEFANMGLAVRFQEWSFGGHSDRNVEATLAGIDPLSDQIYLICAHYDSVPDSPGADDNASGVATVLAAAYVMSSYSFAHTLRFVAFSGEEQGLLGSHEYVEEALLAGDNIVATFNADMIGFAISQADAEKVKVYSNNASLWLTTYTSDVSVLYEPFIGLAPLPSGSSSGSDHYYFWQSGYAAIFYHEYNFNDYYHSPQDILANMNISYNVNVARLVTATAAELAALIGVNGIPAASGVGLGLMAVLMLAMGMAIVRRCRLDEPHLRAGRAA